MQKRVWIHTQASYGVKLHCGGLIYQFVSFSLLSTNVVRLGVLSSNWCKVNAVLYAMGCVCMYEKWMLCLPGKNLAEKTEILCSGVMQRSLTQAIALASLY